LPECPVSLHGLQTHAYAGNPVQIRAPFHHEGTGRKIIQGLAFEYMNDEDIVERPNLWAIKCLDDDMCFQTLSQCAKYYGIKKDTFYQWSSSHHGKRFKYHGMTFERCND
ncbi:hypothetical protein, partial [uncultured Selenomonas sp.]|uniref:hypothetical protein n=1 Tax=uncultured Selenomonas sp. TaxID=159275 RepID=UPI0025F05410